MLAGADLTLQRFEHPLLNECGLQLQVLRADLVHPLLSGNKAFKLRYPLQVAKQLGKRQLLSFGGAWSNHLFSLAAAGQIFGFETIGLLRGEEPTAPNPVLQAMREMGMQTQWLDRQTYRLRHDPAFLTDLQQRYPEALIIPEGGAGLDGVRGAAEMLSSLPAEIDLVACAVGTGTTLAGLISAAPPNCQVLGLAVLKGADYLLPEIENWLQALAKESDLKQPFAKWELETRFHGGGYAKVPTELRDFVARFSGPELPLEPVYTGKAFWGLWQMIEHGELPPGTREICFVHTGGIYAWSQPQ
jgi:1-aminocyclopropane-1-carboxylate deaminase